MGHVPVQEFLNKYNVLDAILRDVVQGDESKGMISLYKDTIPDKEEQLKLRTMNKLRNEIAHGVFPSNEPIKVDRSFIDLLDKHIAYVKTHQKEVRAKMLVAMKKRREKDERERASFSPRASKPQQEAPNKSSAKALPFKRIVIHEVSGVITIEDGPSFYSEVDYTIEDDTLIVCEESGVGRIVLPEGEYECLSVSELSGVLMIEAQKAKFRNVQRRNNSGVFTWDRF